MNLPFQVLATHVDRNLLVLCSVHRLIVASVTIDLVDRLLLRYYRHFVQHLRNHQFEISMQKEYLQLSTYIRLIYK